MKYKLINYLAVFILTSYNGFALSIHQLAISRISDETINIALDTKGVELYYFSSWQYNIDENMIVVEACFVQGFGSTIAYLNNNFEIPINTFQEQIFHLRVNVFYDSFQEESLQDFRDGFFKTPILNDVVLSSKATNIANEFNIVFANPSDGRLFINHEVKNGLIFDESGRFIDFFSGNEKVIDISNLPNGCYFLSFLGNENRKTLRVILRKN
jgi:Secretion system C-terminal sorting domain